jgi:hypothetical protein
VDGVLSHCPPLLPAIYVVSRPGNTRLSPL